MPLVSVQLVAKTISHLSRGRNSSKVTPVPGLEGTLDLCGYPDNWVKREIIHHNKPRHAANPPPSRAAPDHRRR
jgi:hypothetical protein